MSRVSICRPTALSLCCALLLVTGPGAGVVRADGVQEIARAFAESDWRFQRSVSNAPLLPVVWIAATQYGDTKFTGGSGDALPESFSERTVSQAAMLPLPVGRRDAIVLGEWARWTSIDVQGSGRDFDVLSLSLPIGWARQVNDSWQTAAFIAPLGHHRSGRDGRWAWEYMGGAFGRYIQDDYRTWIVGFFADVSPGDDLYVPYVGLLWVLSERWVISALMPWPGVIYAPSTEFFLRLGVTPSGASWVRENGGEQVFADLDAWNLGLSLERRLKGDLWLRAEAGMSGFRGFSVQAERWRSPDTELGSSPYLSLAFSLRPRL